MTETVLVTGGTGYVGGWCIVELLKRGYRVRTTVRSLSKEAQIRAAVAREVEADANLMVHAADLLDDAGWDDAMAGCDYVLHVASPLTGAASGDRYGLVAPARDGTLRVLRAAKKAGVKRLVMTSAAATARQPLSRDVVSDETMWANPDDPQFDAYRVSKILAEKAAWEFVSAQDGAIEFTTIMPGAIFGPVLSAETTGSVDIIGGLLKGQPKVLPKLGFWITDVRDLADIHIRAMTSPHAKNERFIATGDFLWMGDIAAALRHGLGRQAMNVPTKHLPVFLTKLLIPFNPQLRTIAPLVGRRFRLSTEKIRKVLGYTPRPAADTIVDCARSLPDVRAT